MEDLRVDRMHFRDHVRASGGQVKGGKLGTEKDPDAVMKIKKGNVDNGSGGGSKETLGRLVRQKDKVDGFNIYDRTVAQIFKLGGFTIEVMVSDGEKKLR